MYKNLSNPLYNDSKLAPPGIIEAGQKVYGRVCSNCHGELGNGGGPTGAFLPIKPRDFTNCKFQRKRADGELFYVIKFGSWPMPPMIPLITEEEAWEVVAYIRTFCS
jgi:mono/diheme cytochrome c family protein